MLPLLQCNYRVINFHTDSWISSIMFLQLTSSFLQGIANTVLLPSWNSIHICYFFMRLHQRGARAYISNGITTWVCMDFPFQDFSLILLLCEKVDRFHSLFCCLYIFILQVGDCEHKVQQWKSQSTWYSGVCWGCHTIDSLQRNAFIWSFTLTICNSNDGSRYEAQLWQEDTEMDHRFNCFSCRNPVLVFMVSFTIYYKQEIPLPVFQHCYYVLLWCHSVGCLEFGYQQKSFCVGSEGKNRNHNCPVCCKYTFPLILTYFMEGYW